MADRLTIWSDSMINMICPSPDLGIKDRNVRSGFDPTPDQELLALEQVGPLYEVVSLTTRNDHRYDGASLYPCSNHVEAINNAGVACGSVADGDGIARPAVWTADGAFRSLASGPHGGVATAINDRGMTVGFEFCDAALLVRRALAWIEGARVVLPSLDSGADTSDDLAAGVNNAGEIGGRSGGVAVCWSESGDGSFTVRVVADGFSSVLGPNDGGRWCGRVGMPERGDVQQLGFYSALGVRLREFPDVPGTFRYFVTGFNRQDQVLVTGSDRHYNDLGWFALVSERRTTVVDRRSSGLELIAHGLNSKGTVIGIAEPEFLEPYPFIWSSGELIDLNQQIDADSGFTIIAPCQINDRGDILAYADDANGIEHQVLVRSNTGS